ncbi:MAG: SpoIIE family protein phosphatase [bacterium]|nr:SpoIIE family protein phosphatase [bacterium]
MAISIGICISVFLLFFPFASAEETGAGLNNAEGAAPPTQDLHHHNLKQNLPKYSSQKNKNFTDSITGGFKVDGFVWTVVGHSQETLRVGTGPGGMVLSYTGDSFSFQYTIPAHTNPENNKYICKMDGIDENWIKPGTGRVVTYTDLKPGEYVFREKTLNSGNTWDEKGISIKVVVLPSWWTTPSAFFLYFLILVSAVVSSYMWRRKHKIRKKQEYHVIKETEQRAEEAELKANVARARIQSVSEESRRKSIELEDARKFQLSMLPKELPDLPHLDISVSMKTATEVGGDYYDYKIAEDGSLYVVCGDATGHGLKAGTMISVIKTLFVADVFGPAEDFNRFFNECTTTIKKGGLKNLHMALTMLKIENNRVTVSSAGMPPVFIYRKENDMVETITLKGPPLGAIKKFAYHYDYITMEPGDTILLLSDGLPELFDRDKKMFGYDRVEACFKEVGAGSSGEIVSHLNEKADKWLNYKSRDDDMTFMVIKFK